MKDLETKVTISRELNDLLNVLHMMNEDLIMKVEMSIINEDGEVKSFDIEDAVLFNMIKDYVSTKAQKLDANFKLTSF